jgi:hypothetical protein
MRLGFCQLQVAEPLNGLASTMLQTAADGCMWDASGVMPAHHSLLTLTNLKLFWVFSSFSGPWYLYAYYVFYSCLTAMRVLELIPVSLLSTPQTSYNWQQREVRNQPPTIRVLNLVPRQGSHQQALLD